MKAEDVKIGMKVKIVKNPPCTRYGHGEVGRILTVVEILKWPKDTLMAEGFTKSPDGSSLGGISLRYLEPVLEPFTKADLKAGMRLVNKAGNVHVVGAIRFGVHAIMDTCGQPCANLNNYTTDLRPTGGIVREVKEVYAAPKNCEDFFNLAVRGELLFKREEPPVKTEKEKQAEELLAKADKLKEEFEALVKQATALAEGGD